MTPQHKANIARGLKLAQTRRRRSVAMIESWKRRRTENAPEVRNNQPITLDWLKQQALDSATTETQAILDGQPASVTEFWRGQKNAYTNLYNKLTSETD